MAGIKENHLILFGGDSLQKQLDLLSLKIIWMLEFILQQLCLNGVLMFGDFIFIDYGGEKGAHTNDNSYNIY